MKDWNGLIDESIGIKLENLHVKQTTVSEKLHTWVSMSFCCMAIRRRELRVFFSSSADDSCLCIWSSCVTYSSQRWANMARRDEKVAASSFRAFNSDRNFVIVWVTITWANKHNVTSMSPSPDSITWPDQLTKSPDLITWPDHMTRSVDQITWPNNKVSSSWYSYIIYVYTMDNLLSTKLTKI